MIVHPQHSKLQSIIGTSRSHNVREGGDMNREEPERNNNPGNLKNKFSLFEAATLALYETSLCTSPFDLSNSLQRVYASIQHEWEWRTSRICGAPKPLTADLLMPISCFVVASLPKNYRLQDLTTKSNCKPYDVS